MKGVIPLLAYCLVVLCGGCCLSPLLGLIAAREDTAPANCLADDSEEFFRKLSSVVEEPPTKMKAPTGVSLQIDAIRAVEDDVLFFTLRINNNSGAGKTILVMHPGNTIPELFLTVEGAGGKRVKLFKSAHNAFGTDLQAHDLIRVGRDESVVVWQSVILEGVKCGERLKVGVRSPIDGIRIEKEIVVGPRREDTGVVKGLVQLEQLTEQEIDSIKSTMTALSKNKRVEAVGRNAWKTSEGMPVRDRKDNGH